jgi:hypothetical protein
MIMCVHTSSMLKKISLYVEESIECSTNFEFHHDRYDACCLDTLVSLINYEITI